MKKIVLFFLIAMGQSTFASHWQFWSENIASHKISENENLSLSYYSYFSELIGDTYFQSISVSYSNKFYKSISAYGEFYSESSRKSDNTWKGSSYIIPGLFYDVRLSKKISLRLMDRFYYILTTPSAFDYHRPRLSLTFNQGKNTFLISDEMRIDLTGSRVKGFYRNRLFISASRKVSNPLTLGLSWIVQSDKYPGDWQSANILQSSIKVDF